MPEWRHSGIDHSFGIQPARTMEKNDPSPSRAFDPPEEAVWHRMIAEAAYYRAQKVEFAGESALEHWLAAEEEIRQVLTGASTDTTPEPAPAKRVAEPEHTSPGTARAVKGRIAKSAARKREIPKSGKAVEEKKRTNMPDRK
jgi:hypothetical protein